MHPEGSMHRELPNHVTRHEINGPQMMCLAPKLGGFCPFCSHNREQESSSFPGTAQGVPPGGLARVWDWHFPWFFGIPQGHSTLLPMAQQMPPGPHLPTPSPSHQPQGSSPAFLSLALHMAARDRVSYRESRLPMTGEQAAHPAIPTVTSRTTELSLVPRSGSWGTGKTPPGLLAAGTHHLSCHLGVLPTLQESC